jgi:hypothetical protein
MENITTSPIQNINNLIQNYNPFRNMGIVTAQNIWKQEVPDLSTFNKHASDKVFEAINKVKTAQNRDEKITSLVLTAQYGVGKTHILSRIRHQLEHHGGGFFVYGSADTFDLDLIKYQLQKTIADSLSYTGSQGVMQWQEVAAAMFNEAAKAQNPKAKNNEAKQIVKGFDKIQGKNPKLMEQIIREFFKIKNNLDPYIVKAILWTLSENYAPFAVKWLSGEELDSATAQNMGLPTNANKTNQHKEKDALNTILKIVNLVTFYNPLVICFDQLETQKINELGLTTPQVIGELVSSLFNNLETEIFGQGVVILTVMFPDTWENLGESSQQGGIANRLSKYTGKTSIELKYIDQNSIVDMVCLWLKNKLYTPHNLIPPSPIYPFTEEQLIALGKKKPTVREVLEWCTNNFTVSTPPIPNNPEDRFQLALNQENELLSKDDLNNDEIIASALRFGFETLKGKILDGETFSGQTLNNVVITEITNVDHHDNPNSKHINFRIVGTENNQQFKIGLAVSQPRKGPGLQASLTRLIDYEKFDLTRGCIVRTNSYIKPNSSVYSLLEKLTKELGGELVELLEEEIKTLITINRIYEKRDAYNLSAEQILELIDQPKITQENQLLLEILSAPFEEEELNLSEIFAPDDQENNEDIDISTPFEETTEETTTKINDLGESSQKTSTEIEDLTPPTQPQVEPTEKTNNYKGKSITAFTFNGTKHEVKRWKDLLIKICYEIQSKHPRIFDKVLVLSGNKRAYFSHYADELKYPYKIEGTDIYVETNFSSDQVMKVIVNMLNLFGYTPESLELEITNKR